MIFGAFSGVLQVDPEVTAGSLQVVEELVFDADTFTEDIIMKARKSTGWC